MPKNRKIILVMLVTLELLAMYLMYKSSHNKKIVLDKVELKEENKNSSLAILYEKEKGKYEEYTENEFLKNYILNITNSKCIDEYGEELSNILKYINNQITIESNKTSYCTLYFDLPEIKEYNYTGNYQEFIASKDGYYQIELWGASGGEVNEIVDDVLTMVLDNSFGRGAYTKGIIHLNKNEKLYVYVGENNNEFGQNLSKIPFNGGGPGESSGGGATDIRLEISEDGSWDDFNSLKSRIMVAAGGGGGSYYNDIDISKEYTRGDGGSLKGIDAKFYYNGHTGEKGYDYSGHGGIQTSGGSPGIKFSYEIDPEAKPEMTGKFGKGGYGINAHDWYIYTSSGGGGGYYGGGHGNHPGDSWTGGGGGSSFISGYAGCVAIKKESTEDNVQPKDGCTDGTNDINCSYHYSDKFFTETEMKAGNEEMPTHDGKDTMTGNTGNGYAKITFVG